jgi:hypothetical protein
VRLGYYFDLFADCIVLQVVTQLLQSRDPIIGYAFTLVTLTQYFPEDTIQLFRMVEEPGRDLLTLHQVLASLQYFRFGYSHILIAHLLRRREILWISRAQKVRVFLGLRYLKNQITVREDIEPNDENSFMVSIKSDISE